MRRITSEILRKENNQLQEDIVYQLQDITTAINELNDTLRDLLERKDK